MPTSQFYPGSRFLEPIANKINVPCDQLNFIGIQVVNLFLAFGYRQFLYGAKARTITRQIFVLSVGLFAGFFCHGIQFGHVVLQAAICYILTALMPINLVHGSVFIAAMGYLCGLHLYRMVYGLYGLYSLDISGAIMLSTQKLTIMGFGLRDGYLLLHTDRCLSLERTKNAIRSRISFVDYFSYTFYFQSVIAGPSAFYNDFINFIYPKRRLSSADTEDESKPLAAAAAAVERDPSPNWAVCKKLIVCFISVIVLVKFMPLYPIIRNTDPNFVARYSVPQRFLYLFTSIYFAKAKFYLVWLLAEVIHNASGFGFSGYDKNGTAEWSRIRGLDVWGIEFSLNLKVYIDAWNIQTNKWLRYACYERVKIMPMMLTFLLSSVWHGFHPGYYIVFFTGGLVVTVGRKFRRTFRHLFTENLLLKFGYDIFTWILTQFCVVYAIVPFTLLHLGKSIDYLNSFYWIGHIIMLVGLFAIPGSIKEHSTLGVDKRPVPKEVADQLDVNGLVTAPIAHSPLPSEAELARQRQQKKET